VKINACEFVGLGHPAEEGKKLAQGLIGRPGFTWDNLEIDVSGLPGALLISAFFHGFLQHVCDVDAASLPRARSVRWCNRFEYQDENVARLMAAFEPAVPGSAAAEPVALFDLDGTLADFDKAMRAQLEQLRSPGEDPKLDELAYEDLPHMRARRRLVKRQPGFWENLEPIERGFELLRCAVDLRFRATILSKGPRKVASAWSEKVAWCRRHVEDCQIVLAEDKGLVYGRLLVDDWPEYIERWMRWRPRGLVVAVAQPWNVGIEQRFPRQVVRYDGTNLETVRERMQAVRATAGD